MLRYLTLCLVWTSIVYPAKAQNPLITNQFTADPSARIFGNRVYVYPSHDIIAKDGKGRPGWFAMEDYHVFSSANLSDWTDHGVIVSQQHTPWIKPNSYSMWAPDCIERNGKYYFYFPSTPTDTLTYGKGFAIGVAVADRPEGPFVYLNLIPSKVLKGLTPMCSSTKTARLIFTGLLETFMPLNLSPTCLIWTLRCSLLVCCPTKD